MVQTFCLIAGMALLWPVPAMAQQAGFFNVRDHGAAGDGLNDDTQAIRAAISEAGAYVAANPGQIATIYLPEGTYNVCPQDGEPVWQAAVFKIESGNLHFLGDGPDLSVISFHHFGMTDPSTNWKTTDGGYFKIFRANGFSFSMVNSVQNLTFEGLRLTGNAEATGNADVGGAFRDIIHHSGRLYSVNADGMWSSGTAVEFSGFSQTLPPELSADKTYYIINNDPVRPSLFQLAETVDGPALVLTDTGTHFRVRKAGGSSEANIICSGDKLVHLGRSLTETSGIGWDNGVRVKLAPAYASLPPEVDRHAYFYITERAGYTFKVSTEPGGQSFAMSEGSDGRYFRMLNGDGWDMLHKAVSMNTGDWDNIVVDNCRFDRWRGEIIHGGGEAPGTLTIRNSILEHSNGSAASIPSLVMEDSTVRYVYNGVENYARMPWQKMEIRRCTFIASEGRIYGEMNGIVPLALPEAGHIIIEGNTIGAFKTGIYLAESAPGAILQNNVFNDTETPVKITRLGLYPGDPCSFDDITIQNNTFHRTNGGGLVFYTQFGISNKNFVIRYNKLTTDSGEWTAFGQDFCWTPVEQRTGYRIHDNDLSGGGYALDSSSSVRPLWYNNIKPAGFSYASKKDVFMWDTAWSHFKFNNLTIDSYTLNNYTSVDGVGAALDPAYLAKFPVGFTTEIESQTEKGFNLIPAEWNTWTEPVYINKDQSVKLIVGEDGKFSVFDGAPAPAPAPAPEPVAPVAPVLSTGTVGIGSVVLNWTSPEAVDSFELEINEAGAGYAAHAGGVLSGTSTSIELSGLSEGVEFRFRLRSERGGLYSAWVESGPVTTLAPVPVEPPVPVLSIESVNVGSATLGWSTSEQVDSFELEAVPVSNLSLSVITATASGDKTSLSLTNLAAGESYIFRIRAARDGLFSAWTDSPPIPVPAPAPVPPVSPVLAVDSVGIGSVDLSWTISEGVDGFELEINREAAGYLPYAGGAIDGGLTSIQLNALDGNVQYSFRLRAVRSGLVSAWSESETVTTLAPTPTTNPVVAPGMPAINVDAVGVGTVDLSWALDETVDAFELQARQPGSAYATIENGIIDGAARSFQVTGLEQGGRYSFQIRAIRNDLVSDWAKTGNVKIESGPVAPEPPAAPMLAIDAVGIGSVALVWGSEETVDNYELELNEAGAGYAALDSGLFAGSETGVIVEGLLQGGSYTFRLRAIRADLTSGWTESGAVVTLVDDSGSGVGETPVVEATHYWTFDGINGSLIEDAGLAQLPLDLSGATVTDGLAMPESAIRFSGNHTGIIVPDSPTINTDTQSELTISLWVRPDLASADLTSVLYEQGSYWRGLNLIIEKGWLLASGWNRPQNESDWAGTTLNGGELAMGQWNHIALVLSAGPQVEIGGLKLYLNGQLVAEGPASQLWKQNDDNGIGQVQQSTVYRDRQIRALDPYQGDMDEFSIWHLALSEQEIQDLILLSSN